MRATRSAKVCRSRRNSPSSADYAAMQGQDQRHQHGQQGHADTPRWRLPRHSQASPSPDWRSGVKPGVPRYDQPYMRIFSVEPDGSFTEYERLPFEAST